MAFALGLLVFIGSFVPFVGALLSRVVAVLVAWADGGWEAGLAAVALASWHRRRSPELEYRAALTSPPGAGR